jgi:hypothetical protein
MDPIMCGPFRDRKELRDLKEARLLVDVKAAVSIAVTDIQPIVVANMQLVWVMGGGVMIWRLA